MDWSRERYVRLYTRDTGTWVLLSWQARCVMPLLMRRLDRDGKLSVPPRAKPETIVAKLLDVPVRVVTAGLMDLAGAGIIELTTSGIAMPNFAEAQEAIAPSTERVRRHRDRKNGGPANSETLQKHPGNGRVSHETPCLAVPSLAVPSLAVPGDARAPDVPTRESLAADRAEQILRLRERLTLTGEVPQPRHREQNLGNLPVREEDLGKLLDAGYEPDAIVATAGWLSEQISLGNAKRDAWTSAVFYGRWHDSLRQREIPEKLRARATRGTVDPKTQNHNDDVPF